MTHTVTGKLNADANNYDNSAGTTFFVRLGEKNYNFKEKESEWTNYEAAIFAKESQAQFYRDALVEGAIVSVTGKGIIVENDEKYGVKLHIQDAKIVYAYSPTGPAPKQEAQKPQQQAQKPQQRSQQSQPPAMDSFDEDLIPF